MDPCNGIPKEGRCSTNTIIEACIIPSEGGAPYIDTYSCPQGTACQIVDGVADCVLVDECIEGLEVCRDMFSLRVCEGGSWVTYACPRDCISSPIGDFCAPDVDVSTFNYSISYESRSPNTSFTDWGDPWLAEAQGFLVLSANYTGTPYFYDASITDSNGNVQISVPTVPGPDDYILVVAAGIQSDGSLSFVVADPDLTQGSHGFDEVMNGIGPNAVIWSWSGTVTDFPNGSSIQIPVNSGSGAARVFDYLRYVYNTSENRWPSKIPDPIVIWFGISVDWSCGSCVWPVYNTVFGVDFRSQIFLSGGSDEGYWSDAVTAHELGHWAMFSFGRSPNEGGQHCFGVPTLPGQAWSEGWATWFSSDAREEPLYYDKQNGSMFWFSIDTRQYSGNMPWQRAIPSLGLLQNMDENEVSSIMWGLSSVHGLQHDPIDRALSSRRLTVAPFGRGYYTHTWDVDSQCQQMNVVETLDSAPMFADFLDALVCNGVDVNVVDAVTEPTQHYPYPSNSPTCNGPKMPIKAMWNVMETPTSGSLATLRFSIERKGYWPIPIKVRFEAPDEVAVLRGISSSELPANFEPKVQQYEFMVSIKQVPEKNFIAIIDSRNEGAGFHAEVPYRFGRSEPMQIIPQRNGPRVIFNGHDYGPSIMIEP